MSVLSARIICASMFLLVGLASIIQLEAQGLCKEACYRWCEQNRPTDVCRNDCGGRPSCTKKGAVLCKEKCYEWCQSNKPGRVQCLGDCDGRKSC